MFVQQNNQYSVKCYTKLAIDCLKNGEYFDSEEEAQEWVEDGCWIYSGLVLPEMQHPFHAKSHKYPQGKRTRAAARRRLV